MKQSQLLLLLFLTVANAHRAPLQHLPGYKGKITEQYTGYITVDEKNGRALFYWFFPSQNNPSIDPLIFWFQGGPGCSGLIGLFTENGPYVPDNQGGITDNPLSWTQFANVVFLEAPAGVGFSYSNTTSDYNTNDKKTALDNFNFIENWLKEFPEYVANPIWLSGESYAGVYIPTLTDQIIQHPDSLSYAALSGLTIGNPVISCASADYTTIQFDLFYFHGLVSPTVYANWTAHTCSQNSGSNICNSIFETAVAQIGVIYQQASETNQPSLDPDNLYQDFCIGNGTLRFTEDVGYPTLCNPLGVRLTEYLNREDVQQAIGAVPTEWAECANLNYSISFSSMIPFYEEFFQSRPDLSILIYSGDVDINTVPFGFTMACLGELKEKPTSLWQPWFVNGATAGYVEVYEHYTYATVKGGGHEAPQYQPLSSFNMIRNFIQQGNFVKGSAKRNKYHRRSQGRILKEHGIRG